MEQDKVFNLQLTIQKLQEEVSLYRNGANGEELLQLIAEKESEIRALKASAVIKNENLRNLAKKSAEVLARCDRVQSEYDTLQFEHSDLIQEKKRLDAEVTGLQKLRSLSVAECDGKTITINLLEEEVATREESIDKLQARCATLISQQNERNKAYDAEVRDLVADRSSKIGNIKELTVL